MQQIKIGISGRQLEWARVRAGALGISVSEFLRRVIDEKIGDDTHNEGLAYLTRRSQKESDSSS